MKLSQLLSVYPQLNWGDNPAAEVLGLTQDSRQVEPGYVFVAVRGTSQDGHDYLPTAVKNGAIALVVEDADRVPKNYTGAVVIVHSARQALDQLAARFFGNPAQSLFCVGITGTNGKTSVSYMIEHLLTEFGWPTGVLGTINHHLGERVWNSELTTPDPITLQKRMREFVALRAQAVAFEVSSHALDQRRADGIPFNVGVFTNLTRDHLDYHPDMDHYFRAKQRLFLELLRNSPKSEVYAVVNGDDPYGQKLQVGDGVRRWTYSERQGHLTFKILRQDFSGTEFHLSTPRGEMIGKVPLPGRHNVYNAVAAVAVALIAGMSLEASLQALAGFAGVPGRLERVENAKGVHVFVDYAHTDDALSSVLKALNKVRQDAGARSRILTVFGCGGDRDKGKRPLMGQVATQLSDFTVITSDNPRTEDPQRILDDIVAGLSQSERNRKWITEVDRRQAIHRALQFAEEGDVILIAGKGHEKYQIIGQEKRPFDDVAVVKEILA